MITLTQSGNENEWGQRKMMGDRDSLGPHDENTKRLLEDRMLFFWCLFERLNDIE